MSQREVVRTFMLTDIVGSTPMWEAQPAAMSAAVVRHSEILARVVEQHRGVLIREKGEGDSAFAVFREASDAAGAAIAIHSRFEEEVWPTRVPLRVRIGLHTGEAIESDVGHLDYMGTAVNRCARLRALASEGQTAVSQQTAALLVDDLPPETTLRLVGTVTLRGLTDEEQVHELRHASSSQTPLRLDVKERRRLPPPAELFGRTAELQAVGLALERPFSVVSIVGTGGVGKTTLATAALHRGRQAFAGGAAFVDARAETNGSGLLRAMAEALDCDGESDTLSEIVNCAEHREILVVVDNVEQVEDAPRVFREIARAASSMRLVVTSRTRLGIDEEILVPLDPLPAGDRNGPAVQLFLDRARRVRPNVDLSADDTEAVQRICRRVDGLPLAIELAAARLRSLSIADLEARLDAGLGVLDSRRSRRTLNETIEWSWQLLTADEQAALRRLSVFAGPIPLAGAEAVVPAPSSTGPDIGPEDVVDLLESLVDQSLLTLVDTPATTFACLVPIREFATRKLEESGESHETRRAHFDWCRSLLVDGEGATDDALLHADDIGTALMWAIDGGALQDGGELLVRNRPWVLASGRGAELLPVMRRAADRAPGPRERANVLEVMGFTLLDQNRYEESEAAFAEAVQCVGEDSDPWLWYYVGHARLHRGDHATAIEAYERARELAQQVGDAALVSWAANNLGLVASELDDLTGAKAHFEEALEVARQSNREEQIVTAEVNLAETLHDLGERELTAAAYATYLAKARSASQPLNLVNDLRGHAIALTREARFDEALEVGEEAVRLAARVSATSLAGALTALGWVRLAAGAITEAAVLFERALATRDIPFHRAAVGLIAVTARAGDLARARSLTTETVGHPLLETSAHLHLAPAEARAGEFARALECLAVAVRSRAASARPPVAAAAFDCAAVIAATVDRWETVAACHGARDAAWAWSPDPIHALPGIAEARVTARAALGQAEYEGAYRRGAALAPADVHRLLPSGRG